MCDVMEGYNRIARAEGRAEGRTEGKIEGELSKAQDIARQLLKNGMALDAVSQIVKYPTETVSEWLKS